LKVSHLSFSKSGGAGSVASNLSTALVSLGIDSSIQNSIDSDLRDKPFALPVHTLAAGLDEYLIKNQAFSNPVSFLREGLSTKLDSSIGTSDILHLHWTPGQVTMERVGKLLDEGKSIVWTLHDMWPFTAGCHYSGHCDRYQTGCNSCPAVKPIFHSLATKTFQVKQGVFGSPRRNLVFVAPSEWMKSKAQSSSLLANQRIEVIPNPVASVETEEFVSTSEFKSQLGIPGNSFLVLFSAANLGDKRKNLPEVIEALAILNRQKPELNLGLLLIGGGTHPQARDLPIKHIGFLRGGELKSAIANSDVAVNFSRDENLSMAGIEALAAGTPLVVLNSGGNPELVIDTKTGYLVQDVIEFQARIGELASNRSLVTQMGQAAAKDFSSRFEASVVARRYLDLYNTLLKK
jgi:glycosyltransferase involved in cell wall biosynthesis